jgi:antitoxin VapB
LRRVVKQIDGRANEMISIVDSYQYREFRAMTSNVKKPADAKATAKLFMHGRSQAVRLPKEFRFEGTEVRVSRQGDKVVLEAIEKPPFDVEGWRAKLDAFGAADFLPDGLPEEAPLEPDDTISFD